MGRETLDDLRFSVDVSVRYHDRRRWFFDFVGRSISALSILGGSAAVAALISVVKGSGGAGELVILFSATGIAVLNVLDLVFGFSERARLHDNLYRKYIELEAGIVGTLEPTDEQAKGWLAENLLIERDEPSTYHGIYAQCWNQSINFMRRGDEHLRRTRTWRLWLGLGHLVHWQPKDFLAPSESMAAR